MKRISFILLIALAGIAKLFAQTGPYAEMGYDGVVLDVPKHQDFDRITYSNPDTSSVCKKIIIDFKIRLVAFLDKGDNVIFTKSVSREALLRWLTFDPAHQYHSPYVGMGNNPVNLTDRHGTHTNVTDNGDGTYTVIGGELNKDLSIYIMDCDGNIAGTLGQSLSNSSFYSYDKDGGKWLGTIDVNSTEGSDFLNNQIYQNTPGLLNYALNWSDYNFKANGAEGMTGDARDQYYYRGSAFSDGVYASARDFGNYAAGYVAAYNGLSWNSTRTIFDSFNASQNNLMNLYNGYQNRNINPDAPNSQAAERLGFNSGYSSRQQMMQNQLLNNSWNNLK